MREATEALAKRKFGQGGVYNPNTPGAWSDSPKVRGSAQPYTEEFKECVALQAQYIYDTYWSILDHTQRTYEKMALNLSLLLLSNQNVLIKFWRDYS